MHLRIVLLWIALLGVPAEAALEIRDLTHPGDALITLDTGTGLEWLDVSVSFGQGPLAALATFPGFRMATRGEVEGLLLGAGIPAGHVGRSIVFLEDQAAGHVLRNTIGVTFFDPADGVSVLFGRIVGRNVNTYDIYTIEIRDQPASPQGTRTAFVPFGSDIDLFHTNHADFLVRNAATSAPEPATFALVGAILVAVGMRRRLA